MVHPVKKSRGSPRLKAETIFPQEKAKREICAPTGGNPVEKTVMPFVSLCEAKQQPAPAFRPVVPFPSDVVPSCRMGAASFSHKGMIKQHGLPNIWAYAGNEQ
jgi:hypothetical protein